MITDTDITKLKRVFATKQDLKASATKKDLEKLRTEMHQGFREVGERFEEMDEKIDTVAAGVGRIENALDGISGAIQDLRIENSMGSIHLARHDRQIEALAVATKVTLPN